MLGCFSLLTLTHQQQSENVVKMVSCLISIHAVRSAFRIKVYFSVAQMSAGCRCHVDTSRTAHDSWENVQLRALLRMNQLDLGANFSLLDQGINIVILSTYD
jgi:hypothetical protein